MNNQTVRELKALAKGRGLKGYYKLRKDELIALLDTPAIRPPQRAGRTILTDWLARYVPEPKKPIRPPRRAGHRGTYWSSELIIPNPTDMDKFEQQEILKNRSMVKSKLNEWYDWLVRYVPEPIKKPVSNVFSRTKSNILKLYNSVKEKLGNAPSEPQELETAMNKAYKSFRSPGLPKTDVDTYIKRMTPHIKTLIEQQTRELGSAKVQLSLWVKWKKIEERVIQSEDGSPSTPGVYEVIVEKVFNSLMTEVYQGSDIEELLKQMFAHIKTQIDNPALPKSGFTLDSIIHLDINFHELQLTRGSSYIELPKWISLKKAVINPKNPRDDEECFKWAILAALHHEEIKQNPERVSPYSERLRNSTTGKA